MNKRALLTLFIFIFLCFSNKANTFFPKSENTNLLVASAFIVDGQELNCKVSQVTLDGSASSSGDHISYDWSGPSPGSTSVINVTLPGTYTLTVSNDSTGCIATTSLTVIQNTTPPIADAGGDGNLTCTQTSFMLDGGNSSTGNFSYQWLNENGVQVGDEITLDATTGGTYTLVVTDEENGCTTTDEAIVTVDADVPTVSITATNNGLISCNNSMVTLMGTVVATAGANIALEWRNENGILLSTNPSIDVTNIGTYSFTAVNTDNNCSAATMVNVNNDDQPPVANAGTTQTLTCNNNFVTLNGSSSTVSSSLSYQWFNENNLPVGIGATVDVMQIGMYELVVTDNENGCSGSEMVEVIQDATLPMAVATSTLMDCNNINASLDASGSTSNITATYEWSNAAGAVISTNVMTTTTFEGTYTLTVIATNGCSSSTTTEVMANTTPPILVATSDINELNCNNTIATLDGTGSDNNAFINYEWTDEMNNVVSTDLIFQTSTAGIYTFLVTDTITGCADSMDISITQNNTPPNVIVGNGSTLTCTENEATLDGTGSGNTTGNFSYLWLASPSNDTISTDLMTTVNNAGDYILIVTNDDTGCSAESAVVEILQDTNVPTVDAIIQGSLSCNNSNVIIDGSASTSIGVLSYEWTDSLGTTLSTDPTVEVSNSGTYTLTITDASTNCSASDSFIINEIFIEPIAIIDPINGQVLACQTSNLLFNATNSIIHPSSNGTLSYEWFFNGDPVGTFDNVQIGEPGTLELVVTDSDNGCTGSTSEPVLANPNIPNITIAEPETITCLVTEVILDASNSPSGLGIEYTWTGPGNITDADTPTPTVDLAGTYKLVLDDTAFGCTASQTITVTADNIPPVIQVDAPDEIDCVTPQVNLDGSGSAISPNIFYEWTTTDGLILNGVNSLDPLVARSGIYTLTVINDLTGCSSTADVSMVANTDLPAITSFSTNSPVCFGDSNGSISIEAISGGSAPYLFSINGNAFSTVDQFPFLAAGSYDIVIQDVNGCEVSQQIIVDPPSEFSVELGEDFTIQLGDSSLLAPQIVGDFETFTWSNCSTDSCQTVNQNIKPLETSRYAIMLLDENGCTASDDITVLVEKKRTVFIPNIFTPNGDGLNDHFLPFASQEVEKIHAFRVFSRWGSEVFEKLDFDPKVTPQEDGWDGRLNSKLMNPQVFIYYVDIEFIDGRRELLRGDVALRR